MTKEASENPYWSPFPQGPIFDTREIRSWCATAFTIFLGSQGLEAVYISPEQALDDGADPGWENPALMALYQRARDETLPTILLRLAISFRVLQDQRSDDAGLSELVEHLEAEIEGGFLVWHKGNGTSTLRELCNKIIHGTDMRSVHNNDDRPREEGLWKMTGEIEIIGKHGKNDWSVVFHLDQFLDALLTIANWLENEGAA